MEEVEITNLEKIKKFLNEKSYFTIFNNITVDQLKIGYAKLSMEITQNSLNCNNTIHGGLVFTIADMAAGAAALSGGKVVTTLSGNINFLRPANSGKVIAIAKIIHFGKRTNVCEVDVIGSNGKTIGKATITMFVLDSDVELNC